MKDTPDVTGVLVSRPTHVRYYVLAALCVITTINYVQRNSMGGAQTTVQEDLGLADRDRGDIVSAFFLTYALCQIPSGWLAQRWGGRLALTVFAAGWSVVMALTALATSLRQLIADRWLMGAFQAGVFPCATMIVASWYPSTRRGFASAVLNSFMLIGGVFASVLTGLLIGPLGWRWLFVVYAVPGVLWAVWFAVWFRNRPQDHPGVNPAELAVIGVVPEPPPPKRDAGAREAPRELEQGITAAPAADRSSQFTAEVPTPGGGGPPRAAEAPRLPARGPIPWGSIFFSWALLLICLQQFCRAGALRFFDQYLPVYLERVRGQSKAAANLWTSLPMWGGVVGGMIGGTLSDWVLIRTRSRRAARQGVAIVSIVLALLCYASAYLVPNVGWAVAVAGLGVCIMSFSSPCAYALTMDMGVLYLGVIFGTMNMAGNLGSWAFSKFFPRVVAWSGWGTALAAFAAMHVVAILCWLLLNPNGVIGEPPDAEASDKE